MAPIPMDHMSPLVTLVQRKITKHKKTKNNLPKPVLIAIVVIVAVVLLVAILLPIIQRRRKARREAKRDTDQFFSQRDGSNGMYQRASNYFTGFRTGGGQHQLHGAAEQEKYPVDGDYNTYGSGRPGSDSDGLVSRGYYNSGQYQNYAIPQNEGQNQNDQLPQRPAASLAYHSPPVRPARV